MRPTDEKWQESGVTLVEMMVGIVITSLITMGGYQMMTRSQKYLAYKQVDQLGKNEVSELISIAKKDWDYRIRQSTIPGVPTHGFSLLNASNAACTSLQDCPKLRLWIKRKISGTDVIDVVTIENVCRRPTDSKVSTILASLNYTSNLNTNCGTCPKGQIPAVKIEGLNMANNKIVLAAENRLFPHNASQLDKVNPDGIIGIQACFSQLAPQSPLSIDIRSLYRDQSSLSLRLVQKTQVFPFENFARIRLEQ